MAMYLVTVTGLTGFCELLLLPYKCHIGLKNALCNHWVHDNNCCCPLSQRTTVPTALFDSVSTQQQKPQISLLKILILNKQKSIKQLFLIHKTNTISLECRFFFLRLWNSHSSPYYPLDTHFYGNMAWTHDLYPICPGRWVGKAVVKSHCRQTGENIMETNRI